MDPKLVEIKQKIQQSLEHLKKELASIRAGRANPSLVENIPVPAYGTRMKLVEVGTISAPQPSLLTIQVWDNSLVDNVVKAILEANLGLNPATDGALVRLPIPPLTQERREEFIKLTHQKAEETKVSIRQTRQEARQEWDRMEENGEIGEDEKFRLEKLLQEQVDKSIEEVDGLVKIKEEELIQV